MFEMVSVLFCLFVRKDDKAIHWRQKKTQLKQRFLLDLKWWIGVSNNLLSMHPLLLVNTDHTEIRCWGDIYDIVINQTVCPYKQRHYLIRQQKNHTYRFILIYIVNERINYSDEKHHRMSTSSGDNICQDRHGGGVEFKRRSEHLENSKY